MSLPTSTSDMQMETTDPQPLVREKYPIVTVPQERQQKLPSSYLSLSVGDNRHTDLSNEPDPLFYQQSLHLYCNPSIPLKISSGHETGDRVRVTTNCKSNGCRKQRSITSRKHPIRKNKSIYRPKNRMKKKKKKVSKKNINKRKQKSKIIHRGRTRQLRSQSKSKTKKKFLKPRIASKDQSVSKTKSFISNPHARKLNMTNNRVATSAAPSSIIRLIDRSNPDILSNKIKQQTNIPIFNSISQSNRKQIGNVSISPPKPSAIHDFLYSNNENMKNTSMKIKHLTPTPSDLLSSSKKNLRHSKLNIRKMPISKSKQMKKPNGRATKLNIRSPIHTTFKKNVRHNRKQRRTGRKIKYSRCTSKTLIIVRPPNENMIKSTDVRKTGIHTKMSSSLFSLKNNLSNKQSTMPLTKNCAQLTSKNNNRRRIPTKRPGKNALSKRKSMRR